MLDETSEKAQELSQKETYQLIWDLLESGRDFTREIEEG